MHYCHHRLAAIKFGLFDKVRCRLLERTFVAKMANSMYPKQDRHIGVTNILLVRKDYTKQKETKRCTTFIKYNEFFSEKSQQKLMILWSVYTSTCLLTLKRGQIWKPTGPILHTGRQFSSLQGPAQRLPPFVFTRSNSPAATFTLLCHGRRKSLQQY